MMMFGTTVLLILACLAISHVGTRVFDGEDEGKMCDGNPERLMAQCENLLGRESPLLGECKESELVKRGCRIPKYLRPPWALREKFKVAELFYPTNSLPLTCSRDANDVGRMGEVHCSCEWPGNKDWEPASGITDFAFPVVNFRPDMCLHELDIVANMPMCGNEWYEHVLQCSLAQFLNNDAANTLNTPNKEVLVLIDGCALCSHKNSRITGVLVQFVEPRGSFFTSCTKKVTQIALFGKYNDRRGMQTDQEGEIPLVVGPNLAEDTARFTFPLQLHHRECKGLFTSDAPPDNYANATLIVKHTCNPNNRERELKVRLPVLKTDEGHRVFELRGLQLNLDSNMAAQWRGDERGYTHLADIKWWNAYTLPLDGKVRTPQPSDDWE